MGPGAGFLGLSFLRRRARPSPLDAVEGNAEAPENLGAQCHVKKTSLLLLFLGRLLDGLLYRFLDLLFGSHALTSFAVDKAPDPFRDSRARLHARDSTDDSAPHEDIQ